MITTYDERIVRGQTVRRTYTVKDEKGQRVDITGATVHLRIRPDIKAAPVVSKTTGSGITISAQTGSTKGQFVATLAPADTKALPIGDYVYDVWVVEADADAFPVIAPSKFTILPEVTSL